MTSAFLYWIGCSLTGCWEGFRPPPKRDILRLDAIIQTVWDLPCFEMEPHIPCKLAARLWSSAPGPRPLVPGPWYLVIVHYSWIFYGVACYLWVADLNQER